MYIYNLIFIHYIWLLMVAWLCFSSSFFRESHVKGNWDCKASIRAKQLSAYKSCHSCTGNSRRLSSHSSFMCISCISLSLSHTGSPPSITYNLLWNLDECFDRVETLSVQYFSRVASPDKPKSRVIESKLHQSIVVIVGVGFIECRSTVLFDWLMDNSPNQRIKWCLYDV